MSISVAAIVLLLDGAESSEDTNDGDETAAAGREDDKFEMDGDIDSMLLRYP